MSVWSQKNRGPAIITCALLLLTLTALFFLVGIPYIIRERIKLETRLINGSETWNKWANVSVPIYLELYFFNITNPEGVINHGEKFEMQEVGPYTWVERRSKEIVAIDEDEDTVTFKEIIKYTFSPERSAGSQEDRINIVNIPLIATLNKLHDISRTSLLGWSAAYFFDGRIASYNETSVLQDIIIRELVFDGFKLSPFYTSIAFLASESELSDELKDGVFGFYYKKNGKPSKEYKIHRGVKNHADFGKIVTYDNAKNVSYWTNDSCNKIVGTDGSLMPPFLTKETQLYAFSPEICSSQFLVFDKEVEYKGIPAYQFGTPNYSGVKVIPEEKKCFCADPGNDLQSECMPGVFRLFPCKNGAPIILTKPHFLDTPQHVQDSVIGMNPDSSLHETALIIEPNSGALLFAQKRVQISVEFQSVDLPTYNNVTHAFVPVMWVHEYGGPGDDTLAEIRTLLVDSLKLIGIIQWIVLGLLAVLLLVGITVTWRNKDIEGVRNVKPFSKCNGQDRGKNENCNGRDSGKNSKCNGQEPDKNSKCNGQESEKHSSIFSGK